MEQFIGCDAHKKFSLLVAVNEHEPAGRHYVWRTISPLHSTGEKGLSRGE
jgi:hypothetical protein